MIAGLIITIIVLAAGAVLTVKTCRAITEAAESAQEISRNRAPRHLK